MFCCYKSFLSCLYLACYESDNPIETVHFNLYQLLTAPPVFVLIIHVIPCFLPLSSKSILFLLSFISKSMCCGLISSIKVGSMNAPATDSEKLIWSVLEAECQTIRFYGAIVYFFSPFIVFLGADVFNFLSIYYLFLTFSGYSFYVVNCRRNIYLPKKKKKNCRGNICLGQITLSWENIKILKVCGIELWWHNPHLHGFGPCSRIQY